MPFSFMDQSETRLWLKLMRLLYNPQMSREDKKQMGLRYCHHAGYGWRWWRGKRIPDPDEREIMSLICDWKLAGHSYGAIARHLLRHQVVTRAGKEWSVARVRRACIAEARRRLAEDREGRSACATSGGAS
jgi:hypothetical protein